MAQGQTRIIVIEDDKCFVDAVRFALEKEPIILDWAKSSQEAFSLLKENSPYAVAVIDQHLPGILGDELALAIRKQYPELQIIFATGDRSENTLTGLLEAGLGVGFIPKGVSRVSLVEPILKAVRTFENERRILDGESLNPLDAENKGQMVKPDYKSKTCSSKCS